MRKIFCDWCSREMSSVVLNVTLQRRIALTSDEDKHKLNVMIEIEPVDENIPQDLCKLCVGILLTRASTILVSEQN